MKFDNNQKHLKYGFISNIILLLFSIVLVITVVYKTNNSASSYVQKIQNVLGRRDEVAELELWMLEHMYIDIAPYLTQSPNPIKKISMAGKFNSDPEKQRTIVSLKDVWKVYFLGYAYNLTSDTRYNMKALEFLNAWSDTYASTGNPIDESHLIPMIQVYSWVRESINESDRIKIDSWLNSIAIKELNTTYTDLRGVNNWNSHRINIIGVIGLVINNPELTGYATEEFKKHIENNLSPDGSGFDYNERDSLHYHWYNLYALITFAKEAELRGIPLYSYTTPKGSSLKNSFEFMRPFLTGEKIHYEYVNSKVQWDRDSALKNGTPTGKIFDPKESLEFLELYYFFDPSVLEIIQSIRGNDSIYPSLNVLIAHKQRASILLTK